MKYEINPNYPEVHELVENIEKYFQASSRVLYDQRNKINIVSFESEDFVVKAFKVPNVINRFAYKYLRASKARRSFEYALKIGAQLTPEPIAYIEKSQFLLLGQSYYISRHFDYDFTIYEVLSNKTIDGRELILKEFSDFTYKLHELKILHHDYSHGNILIKKNSEEAQSQYAFKIIDINRMQFKTLDLNERLENFARINADDEDMEIIIRHYATLLNMPIEKLSSQAKFFRDEFYRKRRLKNKLRGKG